MKKIPLSRIAITCLTSICLCLIFTTSPLHAQFGETKYTPDDNWARINQVAQRLDSVMPVAIKHIKKLPKVFTSRMAGDKKTKKYFLHTKPYDLLDFSCAIMKNKAGLKLEYYHEFELDGNLFIGDGITLSIENSTVEVRIKFYDSVMNEYKFISVEETTILPSSAQYCLRNKLNQIDFGLNLIEEQILSIK